MLRLLNSDYRHVYGPDVTEAPQDILGFSKVGHLTPATA
jgi:hypothetical protein